MYWKAKTISHKKEKRIAVYFEKNTELITRIKQIEGARWSQSLAAWHIPDTEQNRIRFKIPPLSHIIPSAEGIEQIKKFKQWLRSKRYSESTITTYTEALKSFLVFYREKPIAEITNEDVIVYNDDLIPTMRLQVRDIGGNSLLQQGKAIDIYRSSMDRAWQLIGEYGDYIWIQWIPRDSDITVE